MAPLLRIKSLSALRLTAMTEGYLGFRALRIVSSDRCLFDRWIWLFPLAFAVHFLEEVNGFPDWVNKVLGGQSTMFGFIVSNAVFMAILVSLCLNAKRAGTRGATLLLFAWVAAQQFGNFIFHFWAQIAFSTYSPGVVSATLIYYPTFLAVGYVAVRDKHLSLRSFLVCTVLGFPAMVLFAWANIYRFGTIPWANWIGTLQ